MTDQTIRTLAGRHLCTVEFEVDGVFGIGASPLGDLRVGYVTGGRVQGDRINGTVLPGGGNWSRGGRLTESSSVGTFDARVVWRLDTGGLVYATYTGRSVIADAVRTAFAQPDGGQAVDPADYMLRIAMTFETADPVHAWLNGILAVGIGTKTASGVRHDLYEIT